MAYQLAITIARTITISNNRHGNRLVRQRSLEIITCVIIMYGVSAGEIEAAEEEAPRPPRRAAQEEEGRWGDEQEDECHQASSAHFQGCFRQR